MKLFVRTLAVLISLASTAAFACPLCKDSVPSSDAQAAGSLPGGMNNSVYFMLGGLFFVIGLVSTVVVKGVRDANNQHSDTGERGFPLE